LPPPLLHAPQQVRLRSVVLVWHMQRQLLQSQLQKGRQSLHQVVTKKMWRCRHSSSHRLSSHRCSEYNGVLHAAAKHGSLCKSFWRERAQIVCNCGANASALHLCRAKRGALRRRALFKYEKRLRKFSTHEKMFEYFSSRMRGGAPVMTAADVLRALLAIYPPDAAEWVRSGSLPGERAPPPSLDRVRTPRHGSLAMHRGMCTP
jgi:hypothetical protein